MKNLIFLLFLAFGTMVNAQVAINTDGTAPDNSAMLDVKSTSKGMLIPRMTEAQRDAIVSPATGLLIFCTDNNLYFSNKGTPATPNWVIINSPWVSNGSGINYNGGYVGIGTSVPNYTLDVQNTYAFINVKGTIGWAGVVLDKVASTDNGYVIHRQGGVDLWTAGTLGSNNFNIRNWTFGSDALTLNLVNNNARFSGKIGLKTDPSYDLHINSSDYTAAYILSPYNGGTLATIYAGGTTPGTWGLYAYATTLGYAGYFSGNVYCSGSYLPSDEKLKENILPLQDGLEKLMKLDVKTYDFRTTEFPELNLPADTQYGFTAQNLESVFPELVKVNPAKKEQPVEFKAVNYTGLIPVLTAAIQEQQKQLEAKEERIDLLQKQLDELKILVEANQISR
ncbi:MAG: tail fiber domain-containing protein [Bacteroidales bacterium]|nr:tail fiber domain-containing protein [Bacteroidales bacterium]